MPLILRKPHLSQAHKEAILYPDLWVIILLKLQIRLAYITKCLCNATFRGRTRVLRMTLLLGA